MSAELEALQPGSVTVACRADGEGPLYDVLLRRVDGSLRTLGSYQTMVEADEAAGVLIAARLNGDPWVERLIDVSAGQLRS